MDPRPHICDLIFTSVLESLFFVFFYPTPTLLSAGKELNVDSLLYFLIH